MTDDMHKTYKPFVPDEFKSISNKNDCHFERDVNIALSNGFEILKSGIIQESKYSNMLYWCFMIKKGDNQ